MSKNRKSQLNELYKDPLPVTVFPLPPITPHNPISVLYCLYAYFFPNRPNIRKLVGILSPETRSVWITDETTAHDLWFCGFFGKGTLSRSEPSWYIRTQRLLGIIGQNENLTSEEITARRRATRFVFKAERARQERDILDKTLREEGKLSDFNTDVEPKTETDTDVRTWEQQEDQDEVIEAQPEPLADRIPNLEHLQLTLSEAIFLGVALKVLTVLNGQTSDAIPAEKLLSYCIQSYKVGQISDSPVSTLVPSACPLLIDYVVYHHYRSLGWVVKPGVKFGVDYLLYKRGPVFSHAEFAVVLMPSTAQAKPWHWLHSVNRVNAQVKKTVILCFVEVPAQEVDVSIDLKKILGQYKVREVSIRRWLPSRNRD